MAVHNIRTGASHVRNGLGSCGGEPRGAQDQLNLVGVDAGDGCVKLSTETFRDGSYEPLSRPLFMYPSEKAMARPEVKAFMEFVVANQRDIAEAAKIVPLTSEQVGKAQSDLRSAEQGAS